MKGLLGLAAAFGCAFTQVDCKAFRWTETRDARRWTPAHQTLGALPLLGHMGLPGQMPEPTDPPQLPRALVAERDQSDNTCGFVNGDADIPLYCPTTDVCVYNSVWSYIGCCPESSTTCAIHTTCIDKTDSSLYTTDNGYTLWCGDKSYPNCIRHLYKDRTFTNYTLWGCAVAEGTDTVYYSPTTTGSLSTTSTSGSEIAGSVTSSPTSSTTSSASHTSSSSPPAATTSSTDHKSSTNVGAIAGGVVGGVAAVGLVALGAFFLYRRGKRNGPSSPADPAAAAGAAGQAPPPAPPGGGYDLKPQQMAQQSYYPAESVGFAPVDPRASVASPAYAANQTSQDGHALSPDSPAPTYLTNTTPPPAGYPQQFQDYQTGQQGYQTTQQQQAYQYNQTQTHSVVSHATELPSTRGDGEARELAG